MAERLIAHSSQWQSNQKIVNTYAIPKLLENISYGLKVFYAGHMLQFLLDSLSVVVGVSGSEQFSIPP